jgi:thioredoxin 1
MSEGKTRKILILRIVVAAVVVLLAGGVFILKKSQTSASPAIAAALKSQSAEKSSSVGASSADLHVTTPIDFDALRSSGLPVIIDFGADSCVPCKEMAPVLAELNKSLQGKAIIRFVDVWKYKGLADRVPLQVIPTHVLFDSTGKPFTPPDSLKLEFTMYSMRDTNEHVFTTHEGGLDKPQMLAILAAMGMK